MDSHKVFIIFFAIFAASVLGKPFSIDIFQSGDLLFPRESDLVKRTAEGEGSNDVAELSIPKISLSSFIDNIESGLVQTALSAGSIASDPNAKVGVVTPPHAINKRSTVEPEKTPTNGTDPIVLIQTTEKVLGSDAAPAHVVIDRVSVFKAPVAGSGLFPTFHLQETIVSGETGEVISQVEEDQYVLNESDPKKSANSSSSSESSESSQSSQSSEEKSTTNQTPTSTTDELSSSSSSSSSPVPSTTTSSSSPSTTLLPVDEKKTIENNLKEKVAEVEAEPVILTARV